MQTDCHMVAVKVKYATGAQILGRFLLVVTVLRYFVLLQLKLQSNFTSLFQNVTHDTTGQSGNDSLSLTPSRLPLL